MARDDLYAAGSPSGRSSPPLMACTPADHLAAVGLVAAEYLIRPCPRPVPVLAFHGTADPIVPYADGAVGKSVPGVPVVGVQQNLAAWAALDRCAAAPRVDLTGTGCASPAVDPVRAGYLGYALHRRGWRSHLARLTGRPVGGGVRADHRGGQRHDCDAPILRHDPGDDPLTAPNRRPVPPHGGMHRSVPGRRPTDRHRDRARPTLVRWTTCPERPTYGRASRPTCPCSA